MKNPQLEILFQQMAELTLPECRKCRVPLSCCSPEYCEMAMVYAKEEYNIELPVTDHPRLPFMGQTGCTVPPHLRPLCTLHTCKINGVGTSGNHEWDKKYFSLREQIDELYDVQ